MANKWPYKKVRCPRTRKFRLEQRVVMEQKLGRALEPDEIIHHLDNNSFNNHPDNLYITTRKKHAQGHLAGRPNALKGSLNGQSKLDEKQVSIIKEKLACGFGTHILGREFGVHRKTILDIKKGKTWRHV